MVKKESRFSRRTNAFIWCAMVAVFIGILIYLEQISLLYALATLGLVSLLLIVGFSDLESVGRTSGEVRPKKEN